MLRRRSVSEIGMALDDGRLTEPPPGENEEMSQARSVVPLQKKKQKKALLELELDEDGEPMLGDPEEMSGPDQEKLVRSFVSHHYRKSPSFRSGLEDAKCGTNSTGGWVRRGDWKQEVGCALAGDAGER